MSRPYIVFLSPEPEGNALTDTSFYGLVALYMKATSRSLGIEFEESRCALGSSVQDRRHMIADNARSVAQRQHKPDYIITANPNDAAQLFIKDLNRAGIDTFFCFEGIPTAEKIELGAPRGKLEHFVGERLPDDQVAGSQLARILIRGAVEKKLFSDGEYIDIIGLQGSDTHASNMRSYGLERTIAVDRHARSLFLRPANWDQAEARLVTLDLLRANPQVTVIWAANDTMALGAKEAVEALGRKPGDDILIGGIDWAPRAIAAIEDGTIYTSLGGHFADGAWAMIMLYDLYNGIDFVSHFGSASEELHRSKWEVMNQGNVSRFKTLMDLNHVKTLDFSRYSKHRNPQASYVFGVGTLIH